ncbi:MAG TPA: LAGLIDADG family homing endonuclease [Acidimicrobiales bacterium]|nr:LAGLIDADG family homing endonuclease [Acidimicrobiales bacterium]
MAGSVAGEGCFCMTPKKPAYADGSSRLAFRFEVKVASRDRPLPEALRDFLGYGSILAQPSRRPGWQPTSAFSVKSLRAHRAATIPFAEQYLLPCAKRRQFEAWRDAMNAHELEHPSRWGKGASPCSIPGCERPVRGRRLCRSHYYRETGY